MSVISTYCNKLATLHYFCICNKNHIIIFFELYVLSIVSYTISPIYKDFFIYSLYGFTELQCICGGQRSALCYHFSYPARVVPGVKLKSTAWWQLSSSLSHVVSPYDTLFKNHVCVHGLISVCPWEKHNLCLSLIYFASHNNLQLHSFSKKDIISLFMFKVTPSGAMVS